MIQGTGFKVRLFQNKMSGRAGGKQKPLKAAKRPEKELDDDDKVSS